MLAPDVPRAALPLGRANRWGGWRADTGQRYARPALFKMSPSGLSCSEGGWCLGYSDVGILSDEFRKWGRGGWHAFSVLWWHEYERMRERRRSLRFSSLAVEGKSRVDIDGPAGASTFATKRLGFVPTPRPKGCDEEE